MNDDDRLDARLRELAQDYQRPPETPRDAMWERIQAARRTARPGVRRPSPVWRWGLAIAAVLVLGILIGRYSARAPAAAPQLAAVSDSGVGAPSVVPVAYQVAADQHLSRVETFLTVFQADARTGRVDSTVAAPARGLLLQTQLLLDSPAASDTRVKSLLDDVEFVLAQIAQYSPHGVGGRQDLQFINQGIQQRGVLLRLRTSVPSGLPGAAVTQGAL